MPSHAESAFTLNTFSPCGTSDISECLPSKNRGCFMVTVTFCGATGAVLTAGLAWWLLPTYGWRVFVAACSVPSYIVLVYRCFIRYESPRSLFIRGKKKEGLRVLEAIAAHNRTTLPTGTYRQLLISQTLIYQSISYVKNRVLTHSLILITFQLLLFQTTNISKSIFWDQKICFEILVIWI